jgi:glycosyltransferase involved in cell wall biosynthesis
MTRFRLGIHVHAEPERLHATLASVRACTPADVELLLLPDGADEATARALQRITGLRQLATVEPRGAAACFNRLVAAPDADIFVLLESGSVVTPHWLDCLVLALQADPRHGLAGPSTNLAWNAQCAFPRASGEAQQIERTAHAAASRFGDAWRTLEPLHSLADFCYVVRREVIEAIGAADEGYGLGPCWEMDYNIRAARAGWRGVWACGAYVYRAPFTARRQREERLRFEASKRRYQDKFCALRRLGQRAAYEPHCRGDACEHFALPGLISIRQPLPQPGKPDDREPPASPAAGPRAVPVDEPSQPLVSCIMPTYNRRAFVPLAIAYFLRQDYAAKELIIVDDGTDPVGDLVPPDDRIRYVRLSSRLAVGAKRNRACELARGDIIAHWDDDDWHAPHRLTYQVAALRREDAQVCGINRLLFYDASNRRAWQYTYPADQRFWLAGSSLCYRRSFWAEHRFAEVNVGEDARFLWSDARARTVALPDHRFHIGLIHAHNVSAKRPSGPFWRDINLRVVADLMADDFARYRTSDLERPAEGESPRVSCIMPTFNRQPFVRLAIQNFQAQDYPNKELLIVDDGDHLVENLVGHLPGVRYLRLKQRTSIGAKRNIACREASGEIIAHWDDDDWYAPTRLRYQVEPIRLGQADLSGLENSFVLELALGQFWTTRQQLHQRMFVGGVHGGTLVFRKRLMDEGLCYPEINLAEDAWLLKQALQRGKHLARLANPGVFIYMRHGHNAWKFKTGQFLDPAGWQKVEPPETFPTTLIQAYQAASALLDTPLVASLASANTTTYPHDS